MVSGGPVSRVIRNHLVGLVSRLHGLRWACVQGDKKPSCGASEQTTGSQVGLCVG